MKHSLLFLLCCISIYGRGQTQLHSQNRAEKLCDSAVNVWRRNDFNKALQIINEAVANAYKQNDSVQIARCLINTGLIYSSKGDAVKSLFYYEKALHLLRRMNDLEKLHTTLLNMGISYKEQAIYDKALSYLFETSEYFKEKKNLKSLAAAYNTIGNIFMLEKSYKKALNFHRQALQLRHAIKYDDGIAGSLNNIGIVYKKLNNNDSALFYFTASLKLKEGKGDLGEIATTLSHIAEIYVFEKKFHVAERYYNRAYHLRDSANNKKGIAHSLYELGSLYYSVSNFKKSENYLLTSVIKSKEIKADDIVLRCYDIIRKLYRQTHNNGMALKYDELYISLYKQQLGEENQKLLTQMQVRYETEKKQDEIEQLNREKERREALLLAQNLQLEARKTYIINLVITITLISLIAILLAFLFSNKRQHARKLDEVMREMHHRIKNNFQVLLSLFSLQKEHIEDAKAREIIVSNVNRITAMSLIHGELYTNKDLTSVKISEYIYTLIESLLTVYELKNRNIKLEYAIEDDIQMDVDKAISLGLLINELITNAFKYAFGPENVYPILTVALVKNKDGHFKLTIKDNGNKNESDTHKSFGLKLVDNQIKRLKASMHKTTNNGFEYSISF